MLLPPQFSVSSVEELLNFLVGLWLVAISCFQLPVLLCPVALELLYSYACNCRETQKVYEFSQLNWAFCIHTPKNFPSNFCMKRIFTVWDKHQLIYQNICKAVGENNVCFHFDKWLFSSPLWSNFTLFSKKVISLATISSRYSAFCKPLPVGQVKSTSRLLNSALKTG